MINVQKDFVENLFSIKGKVALVTGASRGIGKACALELAKAGYDIVINYAGNEEAANKTVSEIKDLGQNAVAKKFDVSNKEAVDAAIAEIMEEFGRIDVLVNNAGITKDTLLMRMKKEDFEDVINTLAVSGAKLMSEALLSQMRLYI